MPLPPRLIRSCRYDEAAARKVTEIEETFRVTFSITVATVLDCMNAILVTGATGNVGRPLVNQLADAGVQVRAVTREPDSARFPAGVEVVGSAAAGVDGAAAVFLNSRALGDQLPTVVDLARRAGVRRLVALSAINADDDFSRQPSRFRGDRNKEVEQHAVDSGLEWVSLRPTVFASNFIGMWAPQIRAGDTVSGPYASASTAPIVDADISAVAAHALLRDDLLGRKVALTGPQALTNTELVERDRRCPRSAAALSGGATRPRAQALHRHRVSGGIRRRVYGTARNDGVHARAGDQRGARRSSAGRHRPSATQSGLTAHSSAKSKGDNTCQSFGHPGTSSR